MPTKNYSDSRISDRPRSWMITEADLPCGEQLVAIFKLFIAELKTKLALRTVNRHIDNLWVLGGELIEEINNYPAHRKTPFRKLSEEALNDEGGPLMTGYSEEAQKEFDATCRKFHAWLVENNPVAA
jgi:hypothetical protein